MMSGSVEVGFDFGGFFVSGREGDELKSGVCAADITDKGIDDVLSFGSHLF